jgi:Cu(I)/Ag(I) efflux system membrane fusion protein
MNDRAMKTNYALSVAVLVALILTGAAVQPAFANTGESVLDHYLTVQSALARDSMKNVSASAQALAAAVRADETKSLPIAIAEQADALATAKNLAKARKAFKPLSESLIAYFKANRAPHGTFFEVYCPIAKASWVQAGETVRNPYLGPRSATPTWGWACAGVVKTNFENPPSSKGFTQ